MKNIKVIKDISEVRRILIGPYRITQANKQLNKAKSKWAKSENIFKIV